MGEAVSRCNDYKLRLTVPMTTQVPGPGVFVGESSTEATRIDEASVGSALQFLSERR